MDSRALKVILVFYFIMDNVLYLISGAVVPVLLISLTIYSGYGLVANGFFRFNFFSQGEVYLLLFMMAATVSSLWNNDFDLLLDIWLLAIPFFALKSKLEVTPKFVNTLFVIQILIAILTTYQGGNQFGFLPTPDKQSQFWWRVALFAEKTPPYSGFVASLVLLVNLHFNKTRGRWIMILLAIYFAALSGSRSIYLFWIIYTAGKFLLFAKGLIFNRFIPYIILVVVLFSQRFIDYLISGLGSYGFFNFFARTESFTGREVDLSRLNLYEYFFTVFRNNPLFGVGDALAFSRKDGLDIGSETWFIVLFAAMGFGAVFINLYFIRQLKVKLRHNKLFQFWMLVLFVVVFMFYSSYIKPYNYGTLLCISLILSSNLKGSDEAVS